MHCRAVAVSAESSPPPVEWITEDARLAEVSADWHRVIGIDTEFQRTDTFFPLPGLYQVSNGERVYFLDPLVLGDFSPFLEILEDRRVTKVLHACSEDLELLRHHFGAVPVGLFDTQLANAFVSPDYSLSFTRLLADRLGVVLDQHDTRSDWLQRPLTARQMVYAWEDVYYLTPLYENLLEALNARGRLAWFREEMDARGRFESSDPDTYYLSMKKAWRLSGPARARLQALAAWRERQAMADDRPRNRVVRDEHLVSLAQLPSPDVSDLEAMLPPGIVRRYRDALLDAHADGDAADHPEPVEQPLVGAQLDVVGSLRAVALKRAEALGMAPELLARKREVEACVREYLRSGQLSDAYLGWRYPLVGDDFLERLGRL